MKAYCLLFIITLFLLSSCGKVVCDSNPSISIYFSGFDSGTTNTIIKVVYKNNSAFNTIDHVEEYDTSRKGGFLNDTVAWDGYDLSPDYDYIFYLPKASTTEKLSNISYQIVSSKSPGCCTECSNGIYYKLNGTLHLIAGYAPAYHGYSVGGVTIEVDK